MKKIGNQQMLREINKSLLLNLLYHEGPISRVDLSRRTKLSPTTVSVLIEEAIREGIVHETGRYGSGVGRKMTLLNIRFDNGYVLGVDLSNAPSHFVLLNLRGEVIATKAVPRFRGAEQIEAELPKAIDEFIGSQDVDPTLIKSIGVSVPGLIDEQQENIVFSKFLQVRDFPLRAVLAKALDLPVHLVNDLDAAGFAERFSGAAKGHQTIVYILVDYGVGAGLVLHNQIFRGMTGQAGRISQFYFYSTEVLAARIKDSHPDTFGDAGPEALIEAWIKRGLDGEAPFEQEMEEVIDGLAKYCGGVLQLLNPEQMILGGWVAENRAFFERLAERIGQHEASPQEPTPVKASHWKELGASVGAATLGLHQIFKMITVD